MERGYFGGESPGSGWSPIANPCFEESVEGWAVTPMEAYPLASDVRSGRVFAMGLVRHELRCPVDGCPNYATLLAMWPHLGRAYCSTHGVDMVTGDVAG
jgi:hypothetical protein